MSGPKYYNFPFTSAEEAAGIFAELSAFQHGVKINVVNNQLKFTVSNAAWLEGTNQFTIQQEIDKARARYRENEELKRILNSNKEKAERKRKAKLTDIENEYQKEKKKLQDAILRCNKIARETVLSHSTPFGTYDLSSELDKVGEAERTMKKELASLDERKRQCINECEGARNAIKACNSMSELTCVERTISGIGISISNVAYTIDDVEKSIKNKATRLKNFASVLNNLFESIKDKDMMGYFDRIKEEVGYIDIFDADAQGKIERAIKSIEAEIALLREREMSNAISKEIKEKVSAQIKVLDGVSDALKPMFNSIAAENETLADYTQRSLEIIKESDDIIARINQLEFVNGKNRERLDNAVKTLVPLRNTLMSETTIDRLRNIITELHKLEADCIQGNEIYQRFKKEYLRYEDLYTKLQGFVGTGEKSSEDKSSENSECEFYSPADVMLYYDDPEGQIKALEETNKKLVKLLERCLQESMFGAISNSVTEKKIGEPFKREKDKNGSLHFVYVRPECPGAIFDAECDSKGKLGVYPRGVVLHNGVSMIEADGLKKVHSSCDWADDIHNAFDSFNLSQSGEYEEMPQEVLDMLYDKKNYYHIKTEEESIKYLKLLGKTDEEIEEILNGRYNDVDDKNNDVNKDKAIEKKK